MKETREFMEALEKALEIANKVENLVDEEEIEYTEQIEEILNMKEHIKISLRILTE